MNKELLSQAATIARGLAIDAVHACSSGHLGLPLGAAEIGAVLFGQVAALRPGRSPLVEPRPLRVVGGAWQHVSLRLAAFGGLRPVAGTRSEIFGSCTASRRGIPSSGRRPGSRRRPDRWARASAMRSATRSRARCWRLASTRRSTRCSTTTWWPWRATAVCRKASPVRPAPWQGTWGWTI